MSSTSRDNEIKSPSRTSINVKIPSLPSDTAQGKARSQGTFTPESRISMPASVDFPGSECGTQGHAFSKNRSSPTESQSHSLRHGAFNEKELIQQTAALMIEKAWIHYRDRQMFRLLKHSVCAAENSLSYEILRKVSPREAEFLGDKSQQVRVRFRFGGGEFPPMIFFKIFINNVNQKVKYISGRKMIKPATEAAEDSLRQMGNRIFYDQMLQDTIRQQQCSVSDEVDVTTLKDYMQYLSTLDESPAYQGGKENYWRKLTLDDSESEDCQRAEDDFDDECSFSPIRNLANAILPPKQQTSAATIITCQLPTIIDNKPLCSCTLNDGLPCHSIFSPELLADVRMQYEALSKSKRDVAILAKIESGIHLGEQTERSKKAQSVRKRTRNAYFLHGRRICRDLFQHLHCIGETQLEKLIKHYKSVGVQPRVHASKKKLPPNALSYEDNKRVVDFIVHYADIHSITLPGRTPNHWRSDLQLLPTNCTKLSVYNSYKEASLLAGQRIAAERTFRRIWQHLVPFIAPMKLASDLCFKCQQDLPRHTIFFDVVDFAYNNRVTPRLKQEIPLLASRPVTQEVQVRHIKAISKMRTPVFPFAPMPTPSKSKMSGAVSQMSSRRSRQARLRALKMRKLYSRETGDGLPEKELISDEEIDDYFNKVGLEEGGDGLADDYEEGEDEEEDWDREATQLYQWTQDLSFHDDVMQTPMMAT